MANKLVVTILGGSDMTGACNCMALEYGEDIMVIDLGLGFPEFEMLGVDYLIPNTDYLRERKDRIKGIVLTHGHLDHIGAIPFVMDDLGWPQIYVPRLADALLKLRAQEFGQMDQMQTQIYDGETKLDLGAFKVTFARVNHNIPDSYAVFVETPVGKVVHTGDWKFDNAPYKEPVAEFHKFTKAANEGILLLCSDSTNAMEPGWSDSESAITPDLERVIEKAPGRVVASTFASLITRLAQVIDLSKGVGRKIVVSGRSMENTVEIALKMGLIEAPDTMFVSAAEAARMPDRKVTILATGSQGEPRSSLVRMSTGTHPDITIKEGDTVVLSSSVIPGNELSVHRLRDDLAKRGAEVFHNDLMDVHAGGHPHQEDLKMMLHLTKPKFLMPIQGSASFLQAHERVATSIGFPADNVVLTENGTQVEFDRKAFSIREKKLQAHPLLVDGLGIGDTGPELLKERARIADDGVVFIAIPWGDGKGGDIQVESRGFIYVANNKELIADVKKVVAEAVGKDAGKKVDAGRVMRRVENKVGEFLREKTQKSPLVVPVPVGAGLL